MGYRSKVVFGVRSEYKDKINEILKEHELEETFSWYAYNDLVADKWNIYKGEYLKWYDGYKDVEAINSAIDKIIDESKDVDFVEAFMVCIGEDNQLHNERGQWFDFVTHVSDLTLPSNSVDITNDKPEYYES